MQPWRKLIVPILVSAAGLAAPLAFAVAPSEHSPGPLTSVYQWTATWLMFTLLIAFVLAAGVFRMTYRYPDDPPGLSPMQALMILVGVIAVCGLSVVPILLGGASSVMMMVAGIVVLAAVVAGAMLWPRRRGQGRRDGDVSG